MLRICCSTPRYLVEELFYLRTRICTHFMTIETLNTILKYHNLREVIQREIPRSDYDFYSDWLKYCNAQSEPVRRDLALVGMLIISLLPFLLLTDGY
jgi:hypothetical protein